MTKKIILSSLAVVFVTLAAGFAFSAGLQVNVPTQSAGTSAADPQYAGFSSSCTVAANGFHKIYAGTQNTDAAIVVSQVSLSTGAAATYSVLYDTYSYTANNRRTADLTDSTSDAIVYTFTPGLRFTNGVVMYNGDGVTACVLYMKQR